MFGRWTKNEVLADPDDVAAGHVIRFRRSCPDRIVRSRAQAHPEIVSVQQFTRAQLTRRSRGLGGMLGIATLERGRTTAAKPPYLFRGLVRCDICQRKMQAGWAVAVRPQCTTGAPRGGPRRRGAIRPRSRLEVLCRRTEDGDKLPSR